MLTLISFFHIETVSELRVSTLQLLLITLYRYKMIYLWIW